MPSLTRQLQRHRERQKVREARSTALREAREKGLPPPRLPRKPKKRRGGMRISTPRVGVTLSMSRGKVRFGCPVCRTVLYDGVGTPHEGTMRGIERHVRLCQGRKALIGTLEMYAVWRSEDEELREIMEESASA
ncbi:MAG: hypothetical protein ABIH46_11605 [Chloroflexota bacterium]